VGVVGLGKRMQAVLAGDGRVVCERCAVADGFGSRLRGLLGRRELPQGDGLLLSPSSSVHTLFMRFPIDVVFLDGGLRVVAVVDDVRPWRLASRKGARHVLELPAGEARRRGLEAGQQLSLAASKGPDSERAPRSRRVSARAEMKGQAAERDDLGCQRGTRGVSSA
jgi:uncharacterized membrane protein (UPF0127 family)